MKKCLQLKEVLESETLFLRIHDRPVSVDQVASLKWKDGGWVLLEAVSARAVG